MGPQGLSDIRRGGRRTRVVSANKPSPRPSKRNSEKKKYVEKESSKNVPRKTTADVSSSKPDYRQSNSSGKELPGNETAAIIDSSPPGIALTMDSGKKKILLLRSKDRDNPDVSFFVLYESCAGCLIVNRIISHVNFLFVNGIFRTLHHNRNSI
jgi:regulator of nonsense transcripts 3